MTWQRLAPAEAFPGLQPQARGRHQGAPTEAELGILVEVCRLRQPERALDIGTGEGSTAEVFARSGAEVITIGIARPDIEGLAFGLPENEHLYAPTAEMWDFANERLAEMGVEVIRADTGTFPFDTLLEFDLVFVDGCHSAEYVRNDSEKAWTRLRAGGLMMWHDYQPTDWPLWMGVRDYLDGLAERLPLVHLEGTTLVALEKAAGMRV